LLLQVWDLPELNVVGLGADLVSLLVRLEGEVSKLVVIYFFEFDSIKLELRLLRFHHNY